MIPVPQALDLAVKHHQAGRLQQAEQLYRQILQDSPRQVDALHLLGLIAHQVGRNDAAIDYIQQALRLKPDFAEAHYNLGLALMKQGKRDEAMARWQQALYLHPDYAEAHNNLGIALLEQGILEEAVASFRQALRFKRDYAEAHSNLGLALREQGKWEEAVASYRQALRLQPNYAEAHNNLGLPLRDQGKLAEAVACYQQALRLKPDYAEAHLNLGTTWLLMGNFEQGWPEFEWRRKCKEGCPTCFRQPLWDGSPLHGQTILLHAEHGLGDTLQFIRYAPLVQERGGQVLVVCPAALVPLLARCSGIDRLIPSESPLPSFDVHAPLMSLPGILGTSLAKVPAHMPYLVADADLTHRWGQELGRMAAFKIGIAWQGNPHYPGDRYRSIPLIHFGPLARLKGLRLFSLQKGPGTEQLSAVVDHFPVTDLGGKVDEAAGAFMDSAAVIKNMDLIITSDTAIAHLAGALGVPVWVALPYSPDWRWLLDREDSPWYPTMRLFRQARWGNWQEVFERIAAEVKKLLTKATQTVPSCPEPVDKPCLCGTSLGGERKSAVIPVSEALDLAVSHHQAGRLQQAELLYRQILQDSPRQVDALHLLGLIAFQVGRNDLAVDYINRALRLKPDFAEAQYNLGIALMEQGNREEAMARWREAVRLKPEYAEAHNNLGIGLRDEGKLEEAVASYRQSLRLKPDYAEAHNNLGIALKELGKLPEALASLEEALRLKPDYVEAHENRARLWLLQGNLEQGWPEYEWRWKNKTFAAVQSQFRQPLWDGSALAGRTILLHTEQGLGDTLQFIRYAPLVKERGGQVLVECPAGLVRLLRTCRGIDQLVAGGNTLPAFDVHAPLLNLPHMLGTTLATVPAEVPYLDADAELTAHWQRELGSIRAFKIGINWCGSPKNPAERHRSIPLMHFERLARLTDVHLISLQKGAGTDQLREVAGRFPITDLGSQLDEKSGAFMDTAAVMKNLDLVVTSDTAVPHLAGALGVKVWVALPHVPEWRWLLDREDSPWYPTMRLFRQTRQGCWEDVFERMAGEVKLLTKAARTASIAVEIAPGELIDKITILEIKSARLTEAAKLRHVHVELEVLRSAGARALEASPELQALTAELRAVNETLWQVEDEIRLCELSGDFGPRFIELARSVYQHNDRRAAFKRQINELLGSKLVEEKGYTAYPSNPS